MVAELKISETIYCVRCQAGGMPARVRVHTQIFYQQYELSVTICPQRKEKDSALAVIPSILPHTIAAALLCVLHRNHANGGC